MEDEIWQIVEKNNVISISKECAKNLIEQMEKSFIKIYKKDNTFGYGFFCNIPFLNQKIKVMITSNQNINRKYLKKFNSFELALVNNKNKYEIEYENRYIYTNKQIDITMIEINDIIDKNIIFLDIDKNFFNDTYEPKNYYIIKINKNEKICVSYGTVNDLNNSQLYDLYPLHTYFIYMNCLPIFNLSNNKIMGIHEECKSKYKLGKTLNFIINEFIGKYLKYKNNQKNENIKTKVEEKRKMIKSMKLISN